MHSWPKDKHPFIQSKQIISNVAKGISSVFRLAQYKCFGNNIWDTIIRKHFTDVALFWRWRLHGLADYALDHRSLPHAFEPCLGHIWRVFHLWLRFITCGGRSDHLAYHVHKSGRKKSIIIHVPEILVFTKMFFKRPFWSIIYWNNDKEMNVIWHYILTNWSAVIMLGGQQDNLTLIVVKLSDSIGDDVWP